MSESDGMVRCLRCDTPTKYVRTRALRHGGWNLLEKLVDLHDESEELDLHVCPHCGHVEFFVSGVGEEHRSSPDDDDNSTWRCPQCNSRVPDTFDICWKCEHLRPADEETQS